MKGDDSLSSVPAGRGGGCGQVRTLSVLVRVLGGGRATPLSGTGTGERCTHGSVCYLVVVRVDTDILLFGCEGVLADIQGLGRAGDQDSEQGIRKVRKANKVWKSGRSVVRKMKNVRRVRKVWKIKQITLSS